MLSKTEVSWLLNDFELPASIVDKEKNVPIRYFHWKIGEDLQGCIALLDYDGRFNHSINAVQLFLAR